MTGGVSAITGVNVAARRNQRRELVLHLASRELLARHRFTVLGAAWPLARQLVQLGVLVLVFGEVLDLDIEHFGAFVFCGLVAWSWFATGVSDATGSLLARRHLVFQPRFPTAVLPVVSVVVALVDVLIALPVLAVMLVAIGEVHATALLLPVLLVVQLVLMCGITWITSAASVHLRDVPNLVGVGLLVLFYVTPVFYDRLAVGGDAEDLLALNPLTTLIEAWRDVLLAGDVPDLGGLGAVVALAVVLAVVGHRLFARAAPTFVDEL